MDQLLFGLVRMEPVIVSPQCSKMKFSFSRGRMIAQCAESKVYECDFYGLPAVCKHRFEKEYRHPKLDMRLREQRTAREARALARCALAGIRAPGVYSVQLSTCEIVMERIFGVTVKAVLDDATNEMKEITPRDGGPNGLPIASSSLPSSSHSVQPANALLSSSAMSSALPPLIFQLLEGIGEVVGALHQLGIIHGDLTTSNFMYSPPSAQENSVTASSLSSKLSARVAGSSLTGGCSRSGGSAKNDLVVIDFGLVSEKNTAEDRAVDLYVLLRAFGATHAALESVAEECILQGYCRSVPSGVAKTTLARLEVVRARGRKRSMIG